MRSSAAQYNLIAPGTLREALEVLAAEPGHYVPIAGGTELMVAFNTGRLQSRSLLSLHRLAELRFIREDADTVHIGAASVFTDIRRSETIGRELPLLAKAASWTGSIANQNRATLGGNLCNASPAADTPPALLVYEASVTLVSSQGERRVPYRDFHLGYKHTAMRPEELLYAVHVPRAFAGYSHYLRKVGTRNAQAISKVALACVARLEDRVVADIRIAAASLADRPVRCAAAESVLHGKSVGPADMEQTVRAGRGALAGDAKPIDDIRSTARYRSAVALNLMEEFLRSL